MASVSCHAVTVIAPVAQDHQLDPRGCPRGPGAVAADRWHRAEQRGLKPKLLKPKLTPVHCTVK